MPNLLIWNLRDGLAYAVSLPVGVTLQKKCCVSLTFLVESAPCPGPCDKAAANYPQSSLSRQRCYELLQVTGSAEIGGGNQVSFYVHSLDDFPPISIPIT